MKYEEFYLTTYFHDSDKGNNFICTWQLDINFMSEKK